MKKIEWLDSHHKTTPVELLPQGTKTILKFFDQTLHAKILEWKPPFFHIELQGKTFQGAYYSTPSTTDIQIKGIGTFRLNRLSSQKRRSSEGYDGSLEAPMPGKIIKIYVSAKTSVKKGDVLLVMEAMKMEHKIVSPQDGTVEKIYFSEGERVSQGEQLMEGKGE